MSSDFKSLLKSKLLSNSIWLMVLQVFNTVMPLITLPYITRVLGSNNYGYFSLALNWITYLQVIVEYGFGFTGARKVSINGDKNLQELFSKIITARLILLVFSFIILNIISLSFMIDIQQYISMLILFLMILGISFQLTWLFQGKQDMKLITIINALSRLASIVFVFLLVKQSNHLYLYCFCYSITFILSAILGLLLANKKYGLKVKLSKITDALNEIKDGWYLFLSQAMAKIFSGIGLTVLGFIALPDVAGIYSAIYKIPLIIILFFSPISQALYPFVGAKFSKSFTEGANTVKKCAILILPLFLFMGILIIALRNYIIPIVLGDEYSQYTIIIIPLVFWMLFSIINNFLGVQMLVASGNQKIYSKSFTLSCVVTVFSNVILGYFYSIYGIAIAAPIGEIVLSILLLINILKISKRKVVLEI